MSAVLANPLLRQPSLRLLLEFEFGTSLPLSLPASLDGGPLLVSTEDLRVPGLIRAGRAQYDDLVAAAGAAGAWRLDELSGSAASSAVAAAAAPTGGITYGLPGPLRGDAGAACTFNGTTGFFSATAASSLDVGDTFTLVAWLRAPAHPSAQALLFGRRNASTASNGAPNLCLNTSGHACLVARGLGTIVTGGADLCDDAWHMAAFAKAAGHTRVVIDGVHEDGLSVSNQTCADVGAFWRIAGGTGEFFAGQLAHVASFPTALSPRTLIDLWRAGQWWNARDYRRAIVGEPQWTLATTRGVGGGFERVEALAVTLSLASVPELAGLTPATARGVTVRAHLYDVRTQELQLDVFRGQLAAPEATLTTVTLTMTTADAARAQATVPPTAISTSDYATAKVDAGSPSFVALGAGFATVVPKLVKPHTDTSDGEDWAVGVGNVGISEVTVAGIPQVFDIVKTIVVGGVAQNFAQWAADPYELRHRSDRTNGLPTTVIRFPDGGTPPRVGNPVLVTTQRVYRDFDPGTLGEWKWLLGYGCDGFDDSGGVRDARVIAGTAPALVVGPQGGSGFGALAFDGTQALAATLWGSRQQQLGAVQQFTAEVWFRPTVAAVNQVLLQSPGGSVLGTPCGWHVLVHATATTLRLDYKATTDGVAFTLLSAVVSMPPVGVWASVAVTRDATAEVLWLNRLPVARRVITDNIVYAMARQPSLGFCAGGEAGTAIGFYTGHLGVVRYGAGAIDPALLESSYWRMRRSPAVVVDMAIRELAQDEANPAQGIVLAEDCHDVGGTGRGLLKGDGAQQTPAFATDVYASLTPFRALRGLRSPRGRLGFVAAKPTALAVRDLMAADDPSWWLRGRDASAPLARDWSGNGRHAVATGLTSTGGLLTSDPGTALLGSASAALLAAGEDLGAFFTAEVWLRTLTFSPWRALVNQYDNATGLGWGLALGNSGQVRAWSYGVRTVDTGGLALPSSVVDNAPHHLGVIAAPDGLRWFVDGVLALTTPCDWQPTFAGQPFRAFASDADALGAPFQGALGDVALYPHHLDPVRFALRVAVAQAAAGEPIVSATLGLNDGVWDNLASLDRRTWGSTAESIATLPLAYRMAPSADGATIAPTLTQTVAVMDQGLTAEPLVLPWVHDSATADCIGQVEAARRRAADELLEPTTGHELRQGQPAMLVEVEIPQAGIEAAA